jgi:hypothetical protein
VARDREQQERDAAIRREQQAREATIRQEQQERDAASRREQQAKADAERAEWLAIEQAKRRTPAWFIYQELETEPFAAWCSFFLLLSGLSCAIGVVTQSWTWTISVLIGINLVAYVLGHHRIVHNLPKRLQNPSDAVAASSAINSADSNLTLLYTFLAILIVVISYFVTYCVIVFVISPLRYNVQYTDHYLWIIGRTVWPGRQIKAGAIAGAIISLIITIRFYINQKNSYGIILLKALTYGSLITFLCWLVLSLGALLFNLGWGFGNGWTISLIGLIAGISTGAGLGSSFIIWAKGRPIF